MASQIGLPPLMAAAPAAISSAAADAAAPHPEAGGMEQNLAILVIEPNENVQRMVHAWLATPNVTPTMVADGTAAIAACAKFRYNLIFIDLDPEGGANGFEAANTVRQQGLNTDTPIVGWSSCAEPGGIAEVQERATESGINDVIGKPFNKKNVVDMILTWGTLRVEPLPQLNFGEPLFDVNALAAPDFVLSEPIRPKTAMALVVDDCKLTQHVICSLLKDLTSNVHQAFDGEQAILACDAHAFDVIFMDIRMPKVNGLEATHHIRQASSRNKFTPIIAFTSAGTLEEYELFGVNDLLKKPFTIDSLQAIFDKWTAFTHTDIGVGGLLQDAGAFEPAGMEISGSAGAGPALSAPAPAKASRQAPPLKQPPRSEMGIGGGPWPKQAHHTKSKKPNPLGHTAKEKMRRASIVNSCNAFRTLLPIVSAKDVDKATVFRLSVEYLAFLRTQIPSDRLQELDQKFAATEETRLNEQTAARLDVQATVPAEAQYRPRRGPPSGGGS